MLIGRSYNSVVFQTIAANDIDFLLIEKAFLTTRGGWEVFISEIDLNYEYGENIDDHYQAVQETLLNGQYLNTSRFENISTTECLKRYSQTFITAGNGFAILPELPNTIIHLLSSIHCFNTLIRTKTTQYRMSSLERGSSSYLSTAQKFFVSLPRCNAISHFSISLT